MNDPQYNLLAELYMRSLKQVPAAGTLGEAIAMRFLIRERFMQGFGLWQLVLAVSLAQTDAFLVVSDTYGHMLSDMHVLKPLKVPDKWQDTLDRLLKDAQFEIDKERKRAEAKESGDTVFIAEKNRPTTEMQKLVEQWGELEERRADEMKGVYNPALED